MGNRFEIWVLEDDLESLLIYRQILSPQYLLKELKTIAELNVSLQNLKIDKTRPPALLIADLRLSDGNFFHTLCKGDIDSIFNIPIIVISSCDELDILRDCFNEGIVDYLTKPFKKSELTIKIERLINLNKIQSEKSLERTSKLVPENLAIQRGDDIITQLTARELQIFSTLHKKEGKSVTRIELQETVWKNTKVGHKTLDVHLFNLRKKLDPTDYRIDFIAPESYRLINGELSDRMRQAVPAGH